MRLRQQKSKPSRCSVGPHTRTCVIGKRSENTRLARPMRPRQDREPPSGVPTTRYPTRTAGSAGGYRGRPAKVAQKPTTRDTASSKLFLHHRCAYTRVFGTQEGRGKRIGPVLYSHQHKSMTKVGSSRMASSRTLRKDLEQARPPLPMRRRERRVKSIARDGGMNS